MTKAELLELLKNAHAVPDGAEVVVRDSASKPDRLISLREDDVRFVIDRFGLAP